MIRDGRANIANESLQHPTQKPVELMAWCIEQAMPVQSVFDPFMGSGTLGIACAEAGIPYTGIEIEPGYFDIAVERIENAHRQQMLIA
jgi:DNA modification methylase